MAATVPEYVDPLLRGQITAANLLGIDIMNAGQDLYAVNATVLALLGMVMKALNDHGVVLDAEWQDRLNHALDGNWPSWIVNQTDPP
jgi:hypothetical protein